ncbi:MAG: hypothetical protein KUG59_09570 [Parvibaculaceae bacterium]|nr:hypothetical protein [Parvibaculaceae bacterium]
MFGFSLGGGLSNRFVAWWGDWRLALDFTAGRFHPKGEAGLVLAETRTSSAMVLRGNGAYAERAAGELAIGQGAGLQVSEEVVNLFVNPTLQGLTSWSNGGDGGAILTANVGTAPDGAQSASGLENQNAHNYGTQLYQGVAVVDTPMTISVWGYADEEVDISLKLNDNENNRTFTLTTEMQRFDHSGTIGPALLGGGLGRCGFATGEDWVGKGVVVAWAQITATGGPMPFAVGTRNADNPVMVQGAGGEPFLGYDPVGTLSGVELEDISGLDNWTTGTLLGTGTCTVDVIAGELHVTNTDPTGTGYGIAYRDWTAQAGSVYEVGGEQISGANNNAYNMGLANNVSPFDVFVNRSFADGAVQFIAPHADMCLSINAPGNIPSASRVVDNLSIQEVEPGVVIEAVGVWGNTDNQHVLRLDDGTGDNVILIRRTSVGTIKLFIAGGGVTLYDAASTVAWPDGIEATFRLEITDTDGGCFFAVFLDDVYLEDMLPGALDYPSAIDQLNLAVVSGVKTLKSLKMR